MPRPNSRRDNGCCFDAAIASTSCAALFSANRSSDVELLGRERVDVGDVVHEPRGDQLLDARVREAADVHRAARREVHEPLELPPGTRDVRAVDRGFLLVALDRRAARRGTCVGISHGCSLPVALLRNRPDDLRDHFAGALHLHHVADAQVLLPDRGPRYAASRASRSCRRSPPARAPRTD